MRPNGTSTAPSARPGKSISQAQVVELWGDGPIFPGPGWRLSWDLPAQTQNSLKEILLNGQAWTILQTNFSALSELRHPWSKPAQDEAQTDVVFLNAIATLAEALLQPAELEIRQPYVPAKLRTPCLVLQSDQHELTGDALRLSAALILTAYLREQRVETDPTPVRQALTAMMQKVEISCRHKLTSAQLKEARSRGIPTFQIDPTQRLYQLGTGVHGRWISSTMTDHDSALGVTIAKNKGKTHDLLSQLGLAVPKEIRLPHHADDMQLIAAAQSIGYPCVLKPIDAEQGRGVTSNIQSDEELTLAAQEARKHTQTQLLLQQHINGDDYRLNVIGEQLAFAVKRSPPSITGNGLSTVQELIAEENNKRLASRAQGQIEGEIKYNDPEVIAHIRKASLELTSVLTSGERIQLRRNANISTGGVREEVNPSRIHPTIHRQCLAIARTLRLDNCGIDYITTDISKPPELCGGAYIEVNAMPQNSTMRTRLVLDHLFPESQPHSISTTVIVGDFNANGFSCIKESLAKALSKHPDACIGIPVNLAGILPDLLADHASGNVLLFSHPKQLLLNKQNRHVIFIVDHAQACNLGLPSAMGSSLMTLIIASETKKDGLWDAMLEKYG